LIISFFLDLRLSEIFKQLCLGFDFSKELSASLRAQQFKALLNEWSVNPFFGHGLGASASTIIRSEEMTWAYELSYIALLFQAGLLGFIGYSLAIIWIFYASIKIVRSQQNSAPILLPLFIRSRWFSFSECDQSVP
jgi:O-antigen ligase